MTGERLVVVGAGGYVGSALTAQARRQLPDVTCVGRQPAAGMVGFDQLLEELAAGRHPPATVVWLLAGDRHDEHRHLARFLAAAADQQLRLIYCSSCAVYGAAAGAYLAEDGPLAPQDGYARAKAAGEDLVAPLGPAVCVLRLATLHGHDSAGETKQSVHRLLHHAAAGSVPVYGADNWRPFLHRDSAVTAILAAAVTGLSGVFNVAEDHAWFGDVAGYAARLFDAELVAHDQPDPRSYRVNTARARDAGLVGPDDQALWSSMTDYARQIRAAATSS